MNKISQPKWISGQNQIADILTKALDKTNFLRFLDSLPGLSVSTEVDFSSRYRKPRF